MRIENDRLIQRIQQVLQRPSSDKLKAPAAQGGSGGDRVTLSASVSRVKALHGALSGEEHVRTDRVNALKQDVANGTYRVPAAKIAEKMLSELGGKDARD